MLGNDVVDLTDPEALAGASHPRFDARVFAPAERAALRASEDPMRLRWTLWAAKEAAYKAARQMDAGVVFSPRAFVVTLGCGFAGHVEHAGRRFALRVEVGTERVHAVAAAAGLALEAVRAGAASLAAPGCPARQSAAARGLALGAAAALLGGAPEALAIVREGSVPRLLRRGLPAGVVLSLSHHGRFTAFALAPVTAARTPA